MLMFVLQHQPHRAGTDLRRELVACLLAHGSTFSRVGASGKPGAVHGPADGMFGPTTEAAVKAFQQARGIAADGIVGKVTWINIDEALSEGRGHKFESCRAQQWSGATRCAHDGDVSVN